MRHSDAEGGIELLPIHWLTILKLLRAKNPVLIIQRGKNPPDCSPVVTAAPEPPSSRVFHHPHA